MKRKQLQKAIFGIAFVFLLLVSTFMGGLVASPVSAAENQYTGVLEDLRKDGDFDAAAYPDNEVDYNKSEFAEKSNFYSLHLIQVAESAKGELFLYTYQPSQAILPLFVTSVNMSLSGNYGEDLSYDPNFGNDFIGHTGNVSDSSIGDGGGIGGSSGGGGGGGGSRPCSLDLRSSSSCDLYDLTLLNYSGVFCKYKVNNFTVCDDVVRYYNIVSILRKRNKFVDVDNYSAEIAVKVGKCWTAHTVGDKIYYTNESVDVVEILNPYFGSIRYGEGFDWWKGVACDSHIVAFDTDWDISQLLEADVSFEYRKYDKGMYGETTDDGWTPLKRTVTYYERAQTNASVFGGVKSRSWDRIQSGQEFVRNCEVIDESVAQDISSRQWVLSFYETDYEDETGGVFGWLCWLGNIFGHKYQHGTQVRGVTVLRLKFISSGQVYDLGAVSDKGGNLGFIGGNYKDFDDWVRETAKSVWGSIVSFFTNLFHQIATKTPWWVWLIIGIVVVSLVVGVVAWAIHKIRNKS